MTDVRKVAIIGMHPLTQAGAWRLGPEWELWGLNDMRWPPDAPPPARWFQAHPLDGCSEGEKAWMAQLGTEGGMQVPTYVVPESREDWVALNPACEPWLRDYPVREVLAALGRGWLSNTFCLEMAVVALELMAAAADASLEAFPQVAVALFGTELLSPGRELVVERPALCYWCGLLRGLGASVELPQQSTLALGQVYGLEYWPEARAAAELTEQVLPAVLLDGENLDTVAAVDAAALGAHGD